MSHRYFVPALPPPGPASVEGDLAHHLGRVLRVRPGEVLLLGDGRGGSASATIVAVDRESVSLQVGPSRHRQPDSCRLHVAFAPPRLQRAEWLFEHGTEAGIAVFHPLWTGRTRPQGERTERWLRIVRSAAGQCDRDWLPEVRAPRELAEFLGDPDLPPRRFLARGGATPLVTLAPRQGELLLLVGPEGGFDPEEELAALAAGFLPCGLGPHILRTETAALVGAALVLGR
jgi:16S rRNA (uracil1498-N3)-methyltransferase